MSIANQDIYFFIAGMVYVEWDTGVRCNYIHGQGGIYNVVVCDEPRIPEDGFVAVGCFVKRGKYSNTISACENI